MQRCLHVPGTAGWRESAKNPAGMAWCGLGGRKCHDPVGIASCKPGGKRGQVFQQTMPLFRTAIALLLAITGTRTTALVGQNGLPRWHLMQRRLRVAGAAWLVEKAITREAPNAAMAACAGRCLFDREGHHQGGTLCSDGCVCLVKLGW